MGIYLSQCTFLHLLVFNNLSFGGFEINRRDAVEIQEFGVNDDLAVMFHQIIIHVAVD